jgi:hypothetical protein
MGFVWIRREINMVMPFYMEYDVDLHLHVEFFYIIIFVEFLAQLLNRSLGVEFKWNNRLSFRKIRWACKTCCIERTCIFVERLGILSKQPSLIEVDRVNDFEYCREYCRVDTLTESGIMPSSIPFTCFCKIWIWIWKYTKNNSSFQVVLD